MKYKLAFLAMALGFAFIGHSQVSIDGPTCVLAGVEYQYLISTDDTAGTGIQICLQGGTYVGTENTCLNDSLVSFVLVMWNAGIDSASISFNSPSGSATSTISISTPLEPGAIDTAYLYNTIGYDSTISNIHCYAATGGNCSPSYSYQWEQSSDNLNWDDIENATDQDLDVSVTLTHTSYFRRRVSETNSGTVGYSNTATVFVSRDQSMHLKKKAHTHFADTIALTRTISNTTAICSL